MLCHRVPDRGPLHRCQSSLKLILPKGQSHSVVGGRWYICLHETGRRVNSLLGVGSGTCRTPTQRSPLTYYGTGIFAVGVLVFHVPCPKLPQVVSLGQVLHNLFLTNNVCGKHVGSVADVDCLFANLQYLGLSAELGLRSP